MSQTFTEMARDYHKMVIEKKELKGQLSALEEKIAILEGAMLEYMTTNDIQSTKLEGIGTIYLSPSFFVRVKPDAEALICEWLDEHKLGHMAKRTVNTRTLTSAYKEWMENNLPVPGDDIVDAKPVTQIRLRKA